VRTVPDGRKPQTAKKTEELLLHAAGAAMTAFRRCATIPSQRRLKGWRRRAGRAVESGIAQIRAEVSGWHQVGKAYRPPLMGTREASAESAFSKLGELRRLPLYCSNWKSNYCQTEAL
jgi:hypothetical protein